MIQTLQDTRTPCRLQSVWIVGFHIVRIMLPKQLISTERTLPCLNSSTITARVDVDTLYEEFCCG